MTPWTPHHEDRISETPYLDQRDMQLDTPYALVVLDPTSSTQDEARSRFEDEPVLVVSGFQSAGRGRSGGSWKSAPRAAAISLALAPAWPPDTWPRLPLVAGLAAHRVLGAETRLKWPNDVMLAGNKVAGLLIEGSSSTIVAGLGVNLWWSEPPPGVAALHETDPGPDRMIEIAHLWASEFLAMLSVGPQDWGIDQYRLVCQTVGLDITWEPEGAGRAIGVNEDGTLAVRTEHGALSLSSGSVREIRPANDGIQW